MQVSTSSSDSNFNSLPEHLSRKELMAETTIQESIEKHEYQEMLINCVKEYPCLYDIRSNEHSDKNITDNARIEIAKQLTAAGLGSWNGK